MAYWFLSIFCFLLSLKVGLKQLDLWMDQWGLAKQKRTLQSVASIFREVEELLEAGWVPSDQHWLALRQLNRPWGQLAAQSLEGLRSSGGALLPTLKRLRHLAEDQVRSLDSASAKSSQAFAQAMICFFLVPILGTAFYFFLPAVQENSRAWCVANGLALLWASIGVAWMLKMTDSARWAGVREVHRSWILSAHCAGERFLALVRCGIPPDLAWSQTCQALSAETQDLARAWGGSIWELPLEIRDLKPAEQSIVSTGVAIRKAIQLSLIEGRACIDRVETSLFSLRAELQAHVDRELSLLSTQTLKPLFLCVAPGLFGLLTFGLWLVLASTGWRDENAF